MKLSSKYLLENQPTKKRNFDTEYEKVAQEFLNRFDSNRTDSENQLPEVKFIKSEDDFIAVFNGLEVGPESRVVPSIFINWNQIAKFKSKEALQKIIWHELIHWRHWCKDFQDYKKEAKGSSNDHGDFFKQYQEKINKEMRTNFITEFFK